MSLCVSVGSVLTVYIASATTTTTTAIYSAVLTVGIREEIREVEESKYLKGNNVLKVSR